MDIFVNLEKFLFNKTNKLFNFLILSYVYILGYLSIFLYLYNFEKIIAEEYFSYIDEYKNIPSLFWVVFFSFIRAVSFIIICGFTARYIIIKSFSITSYRTKYQFLIVIIYLLLFYFLFLPICLISFFEVFIDIINFHSILDFYLDSVSLFFIFVLYYGITYIFFRYFLITNTNISEDNKTMGFFFANRINYLFYIPFLSGRIKIYELSLLESENCVLRTFYYIGNKRLSEEYDVCSYLADFNVSKNKLYFNKFIIDID